MTLTASRMLPLGTKAITFELLDTISNQAKTLDELKSDIATVIMFICNHCPYVVHIESRLVSVAQKYQDKGVNFIAISANDADTYPADGPDRMREKSYPFPYLYDADQSVAKAYHAACTPDFYIFNADMYCCYRGRFDAATPGNHEAVTGKDLTHALDCLLNNKPVAVEQSPSMGCNIKWKEPA